ncbi:hypothetical protein H5181_20090 [Shewanella sp. SG44-2]|uniref:hypothetical protein n=1 Tax=Shewanella sp. SG44-2 TaxID=2760962 RepID=UPI00160483B3|nr:hypothetical protein [Shewanella sp. SG44-2]MBB1428734.1 hypothetical protein [Shewanella sp. SG44-2]
MDSLSFLAKETADLYRLGRESSASAKYKFFIDEIESVLHDLPFSEPMHLLLDEMLKAQDRGDWFSLADYIEYELISCLRR